MKKALQATKLVNLSFEWWSAGPEILMNGG